MLSSQLVFSRGLNTIIIYPDQTSIFWDHVISRVPFHGRKRGGTGKEDGLTFEKGLIGLFSGW